jgi:hypothetical protein
MILSKRTWFVISGVTWLGIGVMLLMKGLRFTVAAAEQTAVSTPLLKWVLPMVGSRHQAALLIVCIGLFIGFIKGRTVLAKTVTRIAGRINSHPEGLTLNQAYDRKYWIILCLMMGIGMAFKVLTVPIDIHGLVDISVGSALVNGAMLYFRHILTPQKLA